MMQDKGIAMDNLSFVKHYETDGLSCEMYVGNPVRSALIRNFLKGQVAEAELDYNYCLAFWFFEGYLINAVFSPEQCPTLGYYWQEREGKGVLERWELWVQYVDTQELIIIIRAWEETRRHSLETMADESLEEKKSASLKKSGNTAKAKVKPTMDTAK